MTREPDSLSGDALDLVVRLLFELDVAAGDSDPLHDRICEAICRLTTLERAVLLLYDPGRRLVVPAGSHGVAPEILAHVYGSLEETPMAQRALAEDRVVVVDELRGHVPDRYAEVPTVAGISCTPVAAAGRWLGILLADRDGAPLELSEVELHTMRALGRTAALATTVREAAAHHERDALLLERIELAREVHESVMQRLFGVSMVLGSGRELTASDAKRSAAERPESASIVGLDFDATVAWPAYDWMGVAKAALESTARYLARDLGPRGVRVNLVSAGPLETAAAGGIPGFDQLASAWQLQAPLGWDATDPTPVARAVCFLFSEWATAISGEVLHVDGGFHAIGAVAEAIGARAPELAAEGG